MRGTPRLAQRGPEPKADLSGQTTTEYVLILFMFVGLVISFHESVKSVVLTWFSELVKHLSGPGV